MAKRRPRANDQESFLAAALDSKNYVGTMLSEIGEEILPVLRLALKEGWTRDKLMAHPKVELLMAARQVSIGILEVDSAKALAAIKDSTDRTRGKPTERIETTHRLEKMPDEQLDAMLLSKLQAADSEPDEVH